MKKKRDKRKIIIIYRVLSINSTVSDVLSMVEVWNKTTCRLDPLDETRATGLNRDLGGSRGSHLEGPVYKVRSLGDQGSLRIRHTYHDI